MVTVNDKLVQVTIAQDDWDKFNRLNEAAKAAAKAAAQAWDSFGLPASGKDWATLVKLNDGETASVTVFNGNGTPLAAGVVTQRITPPQPEKKAWIAPRL